MCEDAVAQQCKVLTLISLDWSDWIRSDSFQYPDGGEPLNYFDQRDEAHERVELWRLLPKQCADLESRYSMSQLMANP